MYRNLEAEKARHGVTNRKIAEAIGKSKEAVDKKMQGSCEWKRGEMLIVKNAFFPNCSLDYLFVENVSTNKEMGNVS